MILALLKPDIRLNVIRIILKLSIKKRRKERNSVCSDNSSMKRKKGTSGRFLSKKEGSPARTFRKVFPFIDVGRWWWFSNTKTRWKPRTSTYRGPKYPSQFKTEARTARGSEPCKALVRPPVSPELNVYCFVLFRPVAVGGRARYCLTSFYWLKI